MMAVNGSPENGSESLNSFTGGKLFDTVFGRGMALVEETASYLDGPGREHARSLPREAGLTYSAWSMELTTRLISPVSWVSPRSFPIASNSSKNNTLGVVRT